MRRELALTFVVCGVLATPAFAGRSMRIDCLPDRLTVWDAAEPEPDSRFGAPLLPGVVLGPPADSAPYQGAVTVASLGSGGRAVLTFDDIVIEDAAGPDFIVFENSFFTLPLPTSASEDFVVFAEPGFVEVSADGIDWRRFPHDPAALAAFVAGGGTVDRESYLALGGLAGLTPTFAGNWTVPNVPDAFDAAGQGGVSGAGGDAFDLADVGLATARYVRVVDGETGAGFAGAAEGFDLDAVVVLHGRPLPAVDPDSDGDGLSDAEESALYGSNPGLADSDGDGIDDGREVASCRDPASSSIEPWLGGEPRLWVVGRSCTELRWSFVGTGRSYDVLRADGGSVALDGVWVDLGAPTCLGDDELTMRWSCDAAVPLPGDWYAYLVRSDVDADWGRSAGFVPRGAGTECP